MVDNTFNELFPTVVNSTLLQAVASEDLDSIPDEFTDEERFVVASVRATARRTDLALMCAFVYSEAPSNDTAAFGFKRIVHMQDGHGVIQGCIIVTNQDANNGMKRSAEDIAPENLMKEIEECGLGERCAMIWDPNARSATIYSGGVSDPDRHFRYVISSGDTNLTLEDVRIALDRTYNENLKNPSSHTIRLWSRKKLIDRAEDEIERHIKGQLTMFFAGHSRQIKILSQVNTDAGRADLIFLQKVAAVGQCMVGVLELKVLRGPAAADESHTEEGLRQGYYYREDLDLPFAILALFDVAVPPSDDLVALLANQLSEHVSKVVVIRYPIYDSPKNWRKAVASSPT